MHQTLAKTIYFLLFSSLFLLSHRPHASCPLHSCYMSDILAGLFPFHIPSTLLLFFSAAHFSL